MFIPDGQVSLSAKIDRRGFCEGEDICINAKFENTCSRIVVPKAAIYAKHIYQADGRTKVFHKKLSSVRGNHVISGMCDAWQGKSIRVPKIKPSILGCDIIRVEYALMVRLLDLFMLAFSAVSLTFSRRDSRVRLRAIHIIYDQ